MPQRSITNETARCPISRYGVCSRSHSASIIEFSKCVRRHQVTKLFGFPSQPFFFRKGVAVLEELVLHVQPHKGFAIVLTERPFRKARRSKLGFYGWSDGAGLYET